MGRVRLGGHGQNKKIEGEANRKVTQAGRDERGDCRQREQGEQRWRAGDSSQRRPTSSTGQCSAVQCIGVCQCSPVSFVCSPLLPPAHSLSLPSPLESSGRRRMRQPQPARRLSTAESPASAGAEWNRVAPATISSSVHSCVRRWLSPLPVDDSGDCTPHSTSRAGRSVHSAWSRRRLPPSSSWASSHSAGRAQLCPLIA